MAQADRMVEAQKVVQAKHEAVRACESEVTEIRSQLADAQRKLSEKMPVLVWLSVLWQSLTPKMMHLVPPLNCHPSDV